MDSAAIDVVADPSSLSAAPPRCAARAPLTGPVMRRAKHDLRVAIQRSAAFAAALSCLLGWINLPSQWGNFPGSRIAFALTAFTLVTGWAVRRAVVAPLEQRPLRVLGLLTMGTLAIQPVVLSPAADVTAYSPMSHPLTVGAIVCAISWRPRVAVLTSALAAVSTYLIRTQQVSDSQAAWEGVLTAVVCLAAAAVVILLDKASSQVGRAAGELWELQASAAAGRQREHQRGLLDALVHDAVLGALLLAGRGQDPESAARLAEEAITVLESEGSSGTESAQDWAGRVARTASRLGLTLDLDVRGHIGDARLADALVTGTNEALVNIARHSGQSRARVTARFTPRLLRVTITDDGRGFDPGARGVGRAGIETSIRAPLGTVGGEATISSKPGAGTDVSLRVRPRPIQVKPARWRYADFAPMVLLAFVAIACHGAIAVEYLNQTRVPWVSTLGPLVIAALLAWVWWTPPRPGSWLGACWLSVVVAAVLTANVVNPQIPDWRLWYVGAYDGIVITVAFRFSGLAAMATALGIPTVMAMTVLATGSVLDPMVIANSSTQLIVSAILGTLLRRGLGQAALTLNRVARRSFDLRVEETARAAREEEVRARIDQLGEACLPMLHRLADRVPLTPADRDACLCIEAGIRDHLVARPLIDHRLVPAVQEARARGIRVEMAVDARIPVADVVPFRELVVDVLPLVPPCALVRATWQGPLPGSPAAEPATSWRVLARLVIVMADDVLTGEFAAMCERRVGPNVMIEADDDLVIVELLDPETGQGPVPAVVGRPAQVVVSERAKAVEEAVGSLCPSF